MTHEAAVGAHVDAAAALLGIPLDEPRRAAVAAAMVRLAAFAADVADVPLADDVPIAGDFLP